MKKLFVCFLILTVLSGFIFAHGTVEDAINEVDEFDEASEYTKSLNTLEHLYEHNSDNPEILWRLARNYFRFADAQPDNKEVQKANLYPGFKHAEKCIELAPKLADGHQYYAILIGKIGEFEGTKQKIKNSYPLKEHTLIAISLDPDNDANYHVMGRWHFALADLSWVERKVANIIYSKVPDASFEEAVEYFTKAHNLKKDEIRHLVWLGKTYIKLGNKVEAKKSLQKALNLKTKNDSDKSLQKQAKELLKKV